MRIISGLYHGRRIEAPSGMDVRPTPERVREALFSILGGDLRGLSFIDLYAGAGTVGLEALSRGAHRVVFVEKNRKALAFLKRNLENLGNPPEARVLAADAKEVWPDKFAGADVVFLDPPYERIPVLPYLGEFFETTEKQPILIYQHARGEGRLPWLPDEEPEEE